MNKDNFLKIIGGVREEINLRKISELTGYHYNTVCDYTIHGGSSRPHGDQIRSKIYEAVKLMAYDLQSQLV